MIIADFLLSFVDLGVNAIEIFDPYNYYRKSFKTYRKWRSTNDINPSESYRRKKQGYIEINEKGDVRLTKKSQTKIQNILVKNITIPKPTKWDGKWRIVIFDIPEQKKTQREIFRRRLNLLDFVRLQKSVFVYPHNCYKELKFIAKIYDIESYITFFEVTKIDTSTDLDKVFKGKDIL